MAYPSNEYEKLYKEHGNELCFVAVKTNNLPLLQWARLSKYCPWNIEICDIAAIKNYLPILKWIIANGGPIPDSHCFSMAAKYGHLDIIKFLYEQKCQWDSYVCSISLCRNYLHIVVWLLQHNCPIEVTTKKMMLNATNFPLNHYNSLKWLVGQGYLLKSNAKEWLNGVDLYLHDVTQIPDVVELIKTYI